MEFYEFLDSSLDEQSLQQISIPQLPQYCASIDRVLEHQGDRGRIYCVWGEFAVHREPVRGGVRFTLPGCPNNLAWTLIHDNDMGLERLVIHLTISPQHQELDFIDSIHTFVADWKRGLETLSAHADV